MQRARRRARRLTLVTLLLAVTPAAGFGGSAAPHFSGRTSGAQRLLLRSRCTRLAIDQLLDGGWSNAEIARAFTLSDKDGTGKLSDEEVRQALRAMARGRGVEVGPVEFSGSGSMELGEFKALVKMAFAQMDVSQPTVTGGAAPGGARLAAGLPSSTPAPLAAAMPVTSSYDPVPVTRESMLLEYDATSMSSRQRLLASAFAVGALTGIVVSFFKLAIIRTSAVLYGYDATHGWIGTSQRLSRAALLFPALGGVLVSALRLASPRRRFGPGLAGHVTEVQCSQPLDSAAFASRAAAAVVTLGSGNSLGPEGPSVELGVGLSRLVGRVASRGGWLGAAHLMRRQRQLLAAGAAAGVAAGFNAPVAGIFFALEVVAAAVRVSVPKGEAMPGELDLPDAVAAASLDARRDSAELDVKSRTSISGIVVSAVVAAVTSQEILGVGHALTPAAWPARVWLASLPLYVGLGTVSGVTALLFKRMTAAMRGCFRSLHVPRSLRPATAGLLCGLISIVFPQVLFFGYSTLDAILESGATAAAVSDGVVGRNGAAHTLLPVLKGSLGGAGGRALLPWPGVGLLCAKLLTTSVCVASGLVGGTFAPSLLLGASLGVVYQQAAARLLAGLAALLLPLLPAVGSAIGASSLVSNVPAFAMVGAAALLSSVFRAPLTAAMLLFELTRGEELIMPLLAAAGTGPIVYDAIERRLAPPATVPAGAAAGDEAGQAGSAGQLGVKLGDGLGSVDDGGCEVDLPPECDADNGIATCTT